MEEHNYFGYYEGLDVIPEGAFKISPSRLSRFFDSTSGWYRECFLGEDAFTGNTASNLGTVVHGMAEMYHKTKNLDFSIAERYIDTISDPEVDKDYIRSQYRVMATALVNQFLAGKEGESEPFLHHEIIPGVVVAGSIDLLCPTEVVDYKTTSSLSPPTTIARAHYFQMMSYVWLARQKGMDIKTFRLVYVTTNVVGRVSEKTGKPMKDYPTTVTSLTHVVTPDDINLISDVLQLVAESAAAYKEKPELRHLLAQDLRLKERVSFLNQN